MSALFDKHYLSGDLPSLPVGEFYWHELLNETKDLQGYFDRQGKAAKLDFQNSRQLALSSVRVDIDGALISICDDLHELNLGKRNGSALFKLWVLYVLAACEARYSLKGAKLLSLGGIINFPFIEQSEALAYRDELFDSFDQMLLHPQPFFPETAYSVLFESESKAKQKFNGVNLGSFQIPGEREDDAWLRYCEFQSNSDPALMPDFEENVLFRQVRANVEGFEQVAFEDLLLSAKVNETEGRS